VLTAIYQIRPPASGKWYSRIVDLGMNGSEFSAWVIPQPSLRPQSQSECTDTYLNAWPSLDRYLVTLYRLRGYSFWIRVHTVITLRPWRPKEWGAVPSTTVVKRLECELDHWSAPRIEAVNMWYWTSTPHTSSWSGAWLNTGKTLRLAYSWPTSGMGISLMFQIIYYYND
jgi:hypothetical protein